eukprot:symbB.v1.2.024012.t1/scaffold2242.1/size84735/4
MDEPNEINEEGVVVKTHSICYGCWHGAPLWKRLRLRNTTLKTSLGQKLLGVSEADELEKIGNCLIFPPGDLESVIRSRAKSATKLNKGTFLCRKTYDRAVVLIRDPLDVFRSNYHYRTKVLKVKATPNWKHANYAFVRERAQAYMNFYQGWLDFAHVRPAMLVYYEHLKLRPAQEVRRILQFLEFQFVNEEKLRCAVEQSALGKLKQESSLHNRIDARSFFGSRNETEAQENLSYTFQLLTHFDKSGLFSLASTMGYVTYRGGVPAAQALASGFVESQIEAVSFPWRDPSSTTSAAPVGTDETMAMTLGPQDVRSLTWVHSELSRSTLLVLTSLLLNCLCGIYICRWRQQSATKNARRVPRRNPKLTTLSDHYSAPKWVLGPKPQWSPRKRDRFVAGKEEHSPGPARYSPSKNQTKPSWGFGTGDREWTHLPHDYWPKPMGASPDLYSKAACTSKQRSKGRSFGRSYKPFSFETPDTPGPATHLDVDVQHPRHPAYLGGSVVADTGPRGGSSHC